MAVIDIGPGAITRPSQISCRTIIDLTNPANATGTIDTFEVYFSVVPATMVKMGTFYGSGTDYTSRDSEALGTIIESSKQTFSGLDCDVSAGDYAGIYFLDGNLYQDTSGGYGIYWKAGDQFGAGEQTYALYAGRAVSIYGTGETVAVVGRSFGFIIG